MEELKEKIGATIQVEDLSEFAIGTLYNWSQEMVNVLQAHAFKVLKHEMVSYVLSECIKLI